MIAVERCWSREHRRAARAFWIENDARGSCPLTAAMFAEISSNQLLDDTLVWHRAMREGVMVAVGAFDPKSRMIYAGAFVEDMTANEDDEVVVGFLADYEFPMGEYVIGFPVTPVGSRFQAAWRRVGGNAVTVVSFDKTPTWVVPDGGQVEYAGLAIRLVDGALSAD